MPNELIDLFKEIMTLNEDEAHEFDSWEDPDNIDSSMYEDLKECLTYDEEVVNGYTLSFIEGYVGGEGGGEFIDFLCSIKRPNNKGDLYYNITGYYSSFGGSEIDWSDAILVTPNTEVVTITRTEYVDNKGETRYTTQEDISKDNERVSDTNT